ncbi:M61 family metallopeptidase [Brevundimonas sp. BAL450]|uniref:M61 family metallopeptidase n=2 Tax=Caulobacteraceae TaxID=76892 RepID=UPI0018C9C90B|nr:MULTISPECIES: M61 family metallopeptidase [Brevundimonas]MBG7613779.1 M61 family metallopeptidase [Brevundimonas sp. BAL450]
MKRLILSACAAALLTALPVAAQVGTPALPRELPPIPAPAAQPYPGVIRHHVDATDTERKIIRVRQTIPVAQAGPMVLLYPKYLPGNHAATGPIQLVAGVQVSAGGERVEWVRDPLDPYAFHIEVPAGVSEIEVSFDYLSQLSPSQWRVLMTPEMLNLQFEKLLLYPAGYAHDGIMVQTTVRLPDGWNYGVALDTETFVGGEAVFAPISVEMLADSPMFAGAHYRVFDLDPGGRTPVNMHVVADDAAELTEVEARLEPFRNLVDQADRLYGVRPFDRYEFLVATTDRLGGIGLEHHRSSENTLEADMFSDWDSAPYGDLELLPHEYAHSWNGKFRRPADQATPNLNVPVQNSLLWVYEGQTQYWGAVLAARSELVTREMALANLAWTAAFYDAQRGREWRALQDTVNQNLLGYRSSTPWSTWSRTGGDYYREALLMWLDADTLIREATRDRRSLDDFARAFFGIEDGVWEPRPYTFDDVVAALNVAHEHDWAGFLRTRLDAVGPEAEAPLDGIERGGYRLAFVETPDAAYKRVRADWGRDFLFSLGFSLSSSNSITNVLWDSPAFEAGLTQGWEIVAVNDTAASAERLRAAVTAARDGGPIRLIVKNGDRFRTVEIGYTGGLRYPTLQRIEGTRDRLGDILTPRRR